MTATEDFGHHLMLFVRAFGLHQPERTPCGEPISVSQAHALADLAAEEINHSELARRLRLDRSVVSRLIDDFEDRGWVRRDADPFDRRAVLLVLTPDGRLAAQRVEGARRARMVTLLKAIPADERDNVLRALRVLSQGLANTPAVKGRHAG